MGAAVQRESDILSRTWAALLKNQPDRVWALLDQSHRAIWLTFASLGQNCMDAPWDRLHANTQKRLSFTLTMMTDFFISLDNARREVGQ